MLDMDKAAFTERMNFQVRIPKILVKLSNTYYAKLSTMAKNIMRDQKNNEKVEKTGKVKKKKVAQIDKKLGSSTRQKKGLASSIDSK